MKNKTYTMIEMLVVITVTTILTSMLHKKHFAGIFILFSLIAIQLIGGDHIENSSETFILAADGKAACPVVISPQADPEVKEAAEKLAKYLGEISGAEFKVETGDGKTGIAVGTVKDFSEIPFSPKFNVNGPGERSGYEIKSHPNGIYVIGATPDAAYYAIYDLLERFGYRHYFSPSDWRIVPTRDKLELAKHIRETPDYYTRNIGIRHSKVRRYYADSKDWYYASRLGGYLLLRHHAYQDIISRHKKEFAEHPEYYALVKGKRTPHKFCIANPDLRMLVVADSIEYLKRNPSFDSVSVEPSDGAGWCECEECLKIGTPSTRALFLANEVARAVRKELPGKKVGIGAYSHHSPPPAIDADKDVIVCNTTSFIMGGYSLEQLQQAWQQRKATLGVREFHDAFEWSFNLPCISIAANYEYLERTIPEFYRRGILYYISQNTDGWGPVGLGNYLTAKYLWNIENVKKTKQFKQEFLDDCFGPAAKTMSEFYDLISTDKPRPLGYDLIGRMYRCLAKAQQEVKGHADIEKRIDALILYTRYCELAFLVKHTEDNNKKLTIFKELNNFALSISDYRMINYYSILTRFWLNRLLPTQYWNKPVPGMGELATPKQYSREEIDSILSAGIAANKLLDFEPVDFGGELVEVPAFKNLKLESFSPDGKMRGTRIFYTWVDKKLAPIKLKVTGGLIKHYRDRGNVKINLYKLGGASETGEYETLIQEDASVPPDGKERDVVLKPKQIGLHKVVISDGLDQTMVDWPESQPITFKGDLEKPFSWHGSLYFYVPKGTKIVGMRTLISKGTLNDQSGKIIYRFNRVAGYNNIPVPPGSDGQLWRMNQIIGHIISLMTVPPYMSPTPSGLLLPENIVKKDQLDK